MNSTHTHDVVHHGKLPARVIAALGVVFGDIGTSPLYALRECFHGPHSIALNEANVLGVLSLVVWSLIVVITIKYMVFILNADNHGEGGILSLLALCKRGSKSGTPAAVLVFLGIFGAALLYGDGVLTPAVSVLSAIEGLKIATPVFEPFVIPITVTILVGIFVVQKHGTAKIGSFFGPVIGIWFLTLAVLGIFGIMRFPHVLASANPVHAIDFFVRNRLEGFKVLGSVFLVVTGGEALYADMGHFGKQPMKIGWFGLVLPALLLNYMGQGGLLLTDPSAVDNPFYKLAPSFLTIPLVILAGCATVIASQALISGVFSLTRQAIQLGFCPRLQIVHTSGEEIGQIYVPQINWFLCVGCIGLVLEFKSSSALAAAYGIAVATTMVITTTLAAVVTRTVWKWHAVFTAGVVLLFFPIDLVFFTANVLKIADGGWFPIALGAGVYTLMMTWRTGRQVLMQHLKDESMPMSDFSRKLASHPPHRVEGTAIFMTSDADGTPPALLHNLEHNRVLHENVLLLTIVTETMPSVPQARRVDILPLPNNFFRVIARYGFMEQPNIVDIINACKRGGVTFEMADITFFLGRETLLTTGKGKIAGWRKILFAFMSRNAQRATAFFKIPSNQVVELGIQVEL